MKEKTRNHSIFRLIFRTQYRVLWILLVGIFLAGAVGYTSQTKRIYQIDFRDHYDDEMVVNKKKYLEYNDVSRRGKYVHDGKEETFTVDKRIGAGLVMTEATMTFKDREYTIRNSGGVYFVDQMELAFIDLGSPIGKEAKKADKLSIKE